jgi:hypothetical protein
VPGLRAAGVEWRIHVHEVERGVGQSGHRRAVVANDYEIIIEG